MARVNPRLRPTEAVYEHFYKLREPAFALTPDPAYLYATRQHGLALSMLRYGVMSGAGFCVLTGETGSGKTLVVRHLIESVREEVSVGLLNHLTRESCRLQQWVNLAFGIECSGLDDAGLHQRFEAFLLAEYAVGRRALLVVDEAQNLDPVLLEQLRVLSNVNFGKHMVLQTVLVGQPELLERLQLPQLRQFAQRVSIDFHIGPLTLEETRAYVRHRIDVAGGRSQLFSTEAVALAYEASGGVPRLINQLCDTALVYGFAAQQALVDAELMRQVIEARLAGGIFPERQQRSSRPALATSA